MHSRTRVIWNEGLFIKPQHFQQQQRHMDYQLQQCLQSISQYLFGISQIAINHEYLSFGRIAVERASGVMPDGTVFKIPEEDHYPDPIDASQKDLTNQLIYLALPLRCDSLLEVNWPEIKGTGRYVSEQVQVRDTHSVSGDSMTMDVSPVNLQLMLESEDRSNHAFIAIARVIEQRPDGSIVLDEDFLPCHLNSASNVRLKRFMSELVGLVKERANNIAHRISDPSQQGVADVNDFMLLQALNRYHPELKHLAELGSLHPERLYQTLCGLAGELSTFTDESRLAPTFPSYNHEMPAVCFREVSKQLRQSLSVVLEPKAVSIRLDKRKYGLMVAAVHDNHLFTEAEFIIAVKANMPPEQLKNAFVQQTKIASVEKIRELISLQLPGVPLIPLAVAPRELPYHAGYTYYQLDRESSQWQMLLNSSGFAFHVAAAFEQLDIQFWAIRK